LVVGAVAVRLKGLYLAIATLTLADALGETVFKWSRVTGGQTGWVVQRPKPFVSDASYYVLLFVVAMALVWMVTGLRSSRIGRAMLAVRSNEREAQALGINVYKTKLIAFLISGMLGGVGGGFLALLLKQVTRSAFQSPLVEATSILLVTVVVVGGIDRALGAFLGAVALVVQQQVFQGARFFFAYFGIYSAALLVLFLLYRPGGLMQVARLQWRLILARPRVGIAVGGEDILQMLRYERVAAGLGRTFQHVRLFANLTVRENLLVAQHRHLSSGSWSAMLRLPSWRRDEEHASARAERMLDMIDLRAWEVSYPPRLS